LTFFEGDASHAALMDQVGGRRNDSGPGAFSLAVSFGRSRAWLTMRRDTSSEFDSPLRG
jgi:hypothetical protein